MIHVSNGKIGFVSLVTLFAAAVFLIAGNAAFGIASSQEQLTPILISVHDAPIPFTGSDGRVHLVYELWLTNFSSAEASIEKVEILGDGKLLLSMDAASVASRLQPAGLRDATDSLPKSSQGLLFIHIILAPGAAIPQQLTHRINLRAMAAPPGHQEIAEEGGATAFDRQQVIVIGPPLAGEGFVSADSCCDATRHTRAVLPINGRAWLAQRFAVDWEQVNKDGRIYSGPREKLKSYTIFGKQALAVADATVVSTSDGHPEQTPGKYPANITPDDADGNSVILDLGGNRYALYAHMQPGSIRVHPGQKVRRGDVLGLVGDTGNSLAPHLHFQVMDRPSSLASNGLPYEIDAFQVTGKTPGTSAFDAAEADGTPLAISPDVPLRSVKSGLPLDQLIVSFPQR